MIGLFSSSPIIFTPRLVSSTFSFLQLLTSKLVNLLKQQDSSCKAIILLTLSLVRLFPPQFSSRKALFLLTSSLVNLLPLQCSFFKAVNLLTSMLFNPTSLHPIPVNLPLFDHAYSLLLSKS